MQGRPETGYRLTQKRIDAGALTPELLKMHMILEEAKALAKKQGITANMLRIDPELRNSINEVVNLKAEEKFARQVAA